MSWTWSCLRAWTRTRAKSTSHHAAYSWCWKRWTQSRGRASLRSPASEWWAGGEGGRAGGASGKAEAWRAAAEQPSLTPAGTGFVYTCSWLPLLRATSHTAQVTAPQPTHHALTHVLTPVLPLCRCRRCCYGRVRLWRRHLTHIKVDWDKWVDSDDEGDDNFEMPGDMMGMGGMGGMGGPGGMGNLAQVRGRGWWQAGWGKRWGSVPCSRHVYWSGAAAAALLDACGDKGPAPALDKLLEQQYVQHQQLAVTCRCADVWLSLLFPVPLSPCALR